jgi:hypothetical protein
MPQLDFYLDEDDKLDFMSFVFSEGGYIIPALNYDKPIYTVIKSSDQYRPFVNRSILFFIVHDSYFKYPLTWETVNKEGKEVFYIPQRTGGPTIDFYSPGLIDGTGVRIIGQGNISYYPSYQNLLQRSNVEAPESQRAFYKKISSQIKRGFAIKLSKRTYWVGNKTLESLRGGSKLMNVNDSTLAEFLGFAQA